MHYTHTHHFIPILRLLCEAETTANPNAEMMIHVRTNGTAAMVLCVTHEMHAQSAAIRGGGGCSGTGGEPRARRGGGAVGTTTIPERVGSGGGG